MKYQMPDGMASEPEAAAGDLAGDAVNLGMGVASDGLAGDAAAQVAAALDGLAPGVATRVVVALDGLAPGVVARVVVALDAPAPGAAVPGASNVCGRPWHGLSRAPETILLLPVFLLYTPLLPPLFSYPSSRYPARLKCQILFLSPETSIPGNSPA